MNKNGRESMRVLKAFVRLLPIVFKASPKLFVISRIVGVLHGLSWGVITLGQQRFFDSATLYAQNKTALKNVIISLLVLVAINVFNQLLNGFGNFLPGVVVNKTEGVLSSLIHKKMSRLSPIDFENPSKLDDINKAEQGKSNAISLVMTIFIVLCFYIPYFIFMAWYLFSLKPILVVSIVFVFVPTLFTQLIRTNVFEKLEDKSAPIRRECDYYEKCIVDREFYKETRLLGGFYFFKRKFLDSLLYLNNLNFKANVKTNLIELTMKIITVCGYFGILFMLFDTLMKGEITVGAFAAVFNSVGLLFSIMEEVVCRHFGNIAQNLGTIQNYINFIDLDERTGANIEINNPNITLNNVQFSYPNANRRAISNVSINIKKGETIAIVGENGSGKSTLVKLISGLYFPNKGDVLYNNVKSNEISSSQLYKNISGVFQKFQKYQFSFIDNITISETDKKINVTEIDEICEMSGITKNDKSFSNGYNTMLSREFNGVDLSGGQWQRIAIARGLYRNHDIIVLDEPTAAIDPYEETKLLNLFAEISKEKTAFIVTHRLASAKLADRIIVMKDGEIEEVGTHRELMLSDGEYKRMYDCQKQWYQE